MKVNDSTNRTTYITGIFNPVIEAKLRFLRQKIKEETGLDVPKYRPHVTLMGVYQDPQVVYDTIVENWETDPINSLPVDFRVVSPYPSLTAISIPISNLNHELRFLQNSMHQTFGVDCSSNQFLPNNWKPHVTLVKNINTKIKRADVLECVNRHFYPMVAELGTIGIMSQGTGKDAYEITLDNRISH